MRCFIASYIQSFLSCAHLSQICRKFYPCHKQIARSGLAWCLLLRISEEIQGMMMHDQFSCCCRCYAMSALCHILIPLWSILALCLHLCRVSSRFPGNLCLVLKPGATYHHMLFLCNMIILPHTISLLSRWSDADDSPKNNQPQHQPLLQTLQCAFQTGAPRNRNPPTH